MNYQRHLNTSQTNNSSTTQIYNENVFPTEAQVNIINFVLAGRASETGLFFLLSLIGVTFLLNQVQGRMFRLKIFLMNREFLLIKNETLISVINFILGLLCWVFLLLPFIALAVWGFGLIIRSANLDESVMGGVSVLVVGVALILYDFGMMNIKWNNYRFTKMNIFVIALAHIFYTVYQFLVVLSQPSKENFFGISTIFLSLNCFIMILIVFINSGQRASSMKEFLETLEKGNLRDPNREMDFDEEIQQEQANKNYVPTVADINDLFTIAIAGDQKIKTAFGGGLQKLVLEMGPKVRKILTFVLWGISGGVLVIYAFVVYGQLNKSKLGFVTLVAVLVTDLILYLFYKSNSIKSASFLSVTLLVNRVFLFVFGGTYWIYGYMILYIYYGVILTLVIGKQRFPLEENFDELNLENTGVQQNKVDVSKIPEFLFGLITLIFVALFVILLAVKPEQDTVPTPPIKVGSVEYKFYLMGVFSVILVLLIFTLYCSFRLFLRKMKGIQPKTIYYIQSKKFDMYWIFIVGSYLLIISYTLISYWASKNFTILIVGIFGFLSIILYLNAYLFYSMNDFRVLQDISQLNIKIRRHNQKLTNIKKGATQLKQQIQEGDVNSIGGSEHAGLAKKLLKKQEKQLEQKRSLKLKSKAQNQFQKQEPVLVLTKNQQLEELEKANKEKQNAKVIPPVSKIQIEETKKNVQQPSRFVQKQKQNRTQKPQTEADILVNEEWNHQQESADRNDGMYEGGESEEKNNQLEQSQFNSQLNNTMHLNQLLDSDDSEAEFDPDQDEDNQESQGRRIFKEIPDWRKTHSGFTAYFTGRLRGNDYQIINSFIVSFISIVVMAIILCAQSNSLVGITYAIPFAHYGLAFISSIRSLSTDSNMSVLEYLLFAFAYLLQYGWGVFYLFYAFNENRVIEDRSSHSSSGQFIVVYLIVIPFITSVSSAIGKWIDDNGKFSAILTIQLVIAFFQGIGILVCCFVFLSLTSGIIVSVIVLCLAYVVIQVYIYVKNDYYFPLVWQVINSSLAVLIVIASFVAALIIDGFSNFFGFSISLWLIAFFILLYAFSELISDIKNFKRKPIFFSPWIFPVYIYNPKKNDVESHNEPSIALILGFLILMLWSLLASVWITPVGFGVSVGAVLELVLVIIILQLIQLTPKYMKKSEKLIDKIIIKNAWLQAKAGYVHGRGAPNREQLVTYLTMKQRRDDLRNHLRIREKRTNLNLEERWEGMVLKQPSQINLNWMEEHINKNSFNSCYAYLYEVEKELNKVYIEELELIIQFQLLLIQQAENLKEIQKKYLFTFLNEKKSALYTFGISINIPDQGTLATRYARVISQVQKLSPEKQTMFNSLRDAYLIEKRKADDLVKEREREAQEQQKKRLEEMGKMSDERRKQLENLDPNKPIEQLPDCELKYKKIVEEGKKGKVYTDNSFKPENKSLGQGCLNRGVSKWIRARDIPDAVLYQDSISHEDVVQGALGDCYFLSAISVLGEKYVKDIIVSVDGNDPNEWKKCGAFCVKFYKDGYQEYVIIDDYFPAYASNQWVFVKGGMNGKELWPMVLEKAYAKMYGSYSFIEGGKVQYALADMTDGFPEQIDLKAQGANIQVFWEKLKTLKAHGCLMGAGSPEHPQGDAAINELGIVQGHAYAVIDVQEVDNFRLVQLRNPHGDTGAEWKGDWADDDVDKWNDRMKNRLKFEDKNDGIFWMDVLDFIEQYSYLYICRILGDGWHEHRQLGEWKGRRAEGLPTKDNPKARLELNPQYTITITRPCNGFISLTQMDKQNMFKGKHFIFFMVAKVNGEKISKVDKNTMVCRSGNPINMNIVTSECDFDKSVSYPYQFTLLVANTEHGAAGEGKFELLIYSTDQNMLAKELE